MFPSTSYLPSPYHHNPFAFYGNGGYPPLRRPTYLDLKGLALERERAEALAARRARRAQYLPHEDAIDNDEEDFYGLPNQREKIYLNWRKQREALETLENERRRREAAVEASEGDVGEKMQQYQYSRGTSQQVPSVADQNISSHGLSHSQSSQHRPMPTPTHASASPRREPTPASSPKPRTPPKSSSHIPTRPVVEYTQVHVAAAEKIQKKYRQHRAFKVIDGVALQFEDVKNTFRIPDEIDFVDPERPGEVVTVTTVPVEAEDTREVDVDVDMTLKGTEASGTTAISARSGSAEAQVFALEASQPLEATNAADGDIETPSSDDASAISNSSNHSELHSEPLEPADNAPTPQLAYTTLNYPLHGYNEKLNVLLLKLDDVESFGSKQVRERRKEVAKAIETEATRVDNLWQDAWKRFWTLKRSGLESR